MFTRHGKEWKLIVGLVTALAVSPALASSQKDQRVDERNPLAGWRTMGSVMDGVRIKNSPTNERTSAGPVRLAMTNTAGSSKKHVPWTQRVFVEAPAGIIAGSVVGWSLTARRTMSLGVRLLGPKAVITTSLIAPIAHGSLRDRMGPVPSMVASAVGATVVGLVTAGIGKGGTGGTLGTIGLFSLFSGIAGAGTVELIRRWREK